MGSPLIHSAISRAGAGAPNSRAKAGRTKALKRKTQNARRTACTPKPGRKRAWHHLGFVLMGLRMVDGQFTYDSGPARRFCRMRARLLRNPQTTPRIKPAACAPLG